MKIAYCLTDEAALLAAHSLLPILRAFVRTCDVAIDTRDVSLGARILAKFPEYLEPHQQRSDALAELIELSKQPHAIIVKLPSISASRQQLERAIRELQQQGHALPNYPDYPRDAVQRSVRRRYDTVLGSAVNSALRRGNSVRRIPDFVKAFARSSSHSNGAWSQASRTHVATMAEGDFRSTERALTVAEGGAWRIEHVADDGAITVLRDSVPVAPGDVVDGAVMRRVALERFLAREVRSARMADVLFCLQLKSTVMRVSDPIILGHAVKAYYAPLLEAHGSSLNHCGVDLTKGFAAIASAAEQLLDREAFDRCVAAIHQRGPRLAMQDVTLGHSTLHAPGGSSIGASMAAALRASGQMPDADGRRRDTKFVIPDHTYADLYRVTIADCIARGALQPATLGSATIVGLTAARAQEYGSTETTFEIRAPGRVRLVTEPGECRLEHAVAPGDIWRLCHAADWAIRDWIQRGIAFAGGEGGAVVFWLDATRPRDRELIRKLRAAQAGAGEAGVAVMDVAAATRFTLGELRAGRDVVAVVGNVLRDYLTELIGALEVGTSAMAQATTWLPGGGLLLEAGSGGCAPKLFRQFLETNHLRWNSLGACVAVITALEAVAHAAQHQRAQALAQALGRACQRLLIEGRTPSRHVGGLDTRDSHFYLAHLWALEMRDDADLGARFAKLADRLSFEREQIERELAAAQGQRVELGGYYHPDPRELRAALCPSPTLMAALTDFDAAAADL
jgi:isocitrate dehydrogenase